MAYGQTAVNTRFDFDAVAVIAATNRRAERKKLRRLRKVRRALRYMAFLAYWAIFTGIAWALTLAAMIVFLRLS